VALGYLQDYADTSEKAHQELKSCMWQLAKSRRHSTTASTAVLLREELRAHIRIVDKNNEKGIDLVDEDSLEPLINEYSSESSSSYFPRWNLHNLLSEEKKTRNASTAESSTSPPEHDKTISSGMRQRKTVNRTGSNRSVDKATDNLCSKETERAPKEETASSWMMVQGEDLNSDDDNNVLRRDPIELFGGWMSPREMKLAQRNSRKALNGYIKAANEAAILLALLREEEDRQM